MMTSAQVVETSVNTNNSPSENYTTNPDDHSNHNSDESLLIFLPVNLTIENVFILETLAEGILHLSPHNPLFKLGSKVPGKEVHLHNLAGCAAQQFGPDRVYL